jgi:hypothetical protein
MAQYNAIIISRSVMVGSYLTIERASIRAADAFANLANKHSEA